MRTERAAAPQQAVETSANASGTETMAAPLAAMAEVPLEITVRIGSARLTLGELLKLRPGAVLGLDKTVGEPAEIMVGDKVVALGQMVMVGEELGVRVIELAAGPGTP